MKDLLQQDVALIPAVFYPYITKGAAFSRIVDIMYESCCKAVTCDLLFLRSGRSLESKARMKIV